MGETDLGMPIGVLHARPSKRNAVQHGHVVADDRGLSDYDAGAVIDEDALAEPRARMYVYLELLVNLFCSWSVVYVFRLFRYVLFCFESNG